MSVKLDEWLHMLKGDKSRALFCLVALVFASIAIACLPGCGSGSAPTSNEDPIVLDNLEVGKTIQFGAYEQDNDASNGAEPIDWRVLAVQDGKALLISEYVLDCKQYDSNVKNNEWDQCALKKWLEVDFAKKAFNGEEIATLEGSPTCLSALEAREFFASEDDCVASPTEYADAQGVEVNDGHTYWWLRSFDSKGDGADCVGTGGAAVNESNGVRVAVWVKALGENCVPSIVPLSEAETGKRVMFGSYEQDDNDESGKEPIMWRVLDVQDGRAFLVSELALAEKQFNSSVDKGNKWESSDLRAWLVGDFANDAFSDEDKARIDGEPFCLSVEEAEKYFASDDDRVCKTSLGLEYDSFAWYWWLRSPGDGDGNAAVVLYGGGVDSIGYGVDLDRNAVRPALWVNL